MASVRESRVLPAAGAGARPAPSPQPGRTRSLSGPVRPRPASQRRQLPWRGHRRRHLQLHVNTRPGKVTCGRPLLLPPPPAPPPRALAAPGPSARRRPPPARLSPSPAGAAPGGEGSTPAGRGRRRGQRARTAPVGTPPSTPLSTPPRPAGRGGGSRCPQKNSAAEAPGARWTATRALNGQLPSSAAPPIPRLWREGEF
ncbi:uncharacterized protein LOC135294585 [Passer domesticus]|uniref:uncharacterized protein LOC135294585 n=1 Tax=Passer domesticus TaxID=48849 RepID=UPI0030FE7F47